MKKNQKILAAVAAIIVVVLIVVGVMISTKNTNEETSSSTNVETSEVVATEESTKVESSTEVLASIGTAPEDSSSTIDKSDAINFPGSETEVSTSENNTVTSNTEVSTSESNTQTSNTKNETSESKTETSVSSTSESSTSKTETSTSETSTSTEPTTSESSTTTPVDNSSSTPSTPAPGEQIAQGSTGTTSLGTTYPIVSEFNKLGLDSNSTTFFSTSGYGSDFAKAFGQGNKALGDVLGYEAGCIDVTNTYISCLDAHITRQPDKSQYIFTYADNITTDSDGGTIARARHQVMLGAITSTPVEVEQALFEDCFTDNEHFSLDTWVTVGDCQIRFVYSGDNGVEYAIRPKN